MTFLASICPMLLLLTLAKANRGEEENKISLKSLKKA
jgi:hypothetical protein